MRIGRVARERPLMDLAPQIPQVPDEDQGLMRRQTVPSNEYWQQQPLLRMKTPTTPFIQSVAMFCYCCLGKSCTSLPGCTATEEAAHRPFYKTHL